MRRIEVLYLALGLLGTACSSGESDAGGGGAAASTVTSTSASVVSSGAVTSASSGAGGEPATSPCSDNVGCGYGSFCDAPEGTCPSETNPGVCRPFPDCEDAPSDQITCGCNGVVYTSACKVQNAYDDIGPQEGCAAPSSPFACSSALCAGGVEFCTTTNGVPRCKPIPAECASPATSCDCLTPYFCFSAPGTPSCAQDDEGNVTVTCEVTE